MSEREEKEGNENEASLQKCINWRLALFTLRPMSLDLAHTKK